MNKIVFLVSGNGGNLRFIHHFIKYSKDNDFVIASVIADRKCPALEFADKNSIDHQLIKYTKDHNEELIQKLNAIEPDMIITNIHKILDNKIVQQYADVLINLHYSLLPSFKGLLGVEPIERALALGCKFIGTTVHQVEEEVDSGKIICQSSFPVPETSDKKAIVEHVFRSGCLTLLNALYILSGKKLNNRTTLFKDDIYVSTFSPGLTYSIDEVPSDIWKKIAD